MILRCIADDDTVRALRLAGVRGDIAHTPEQATALFQRAIDDPDCGLVIVGERAAAALGNQLLAVQLERDRPLLVVVPGASGPIQAARSAQQWVREAVGIRLNPEAPREPAPGTQGSRPS